MTERTLKTSGFSGFSLWPLSSVKFRQVRFLTLDSKSVCEQSHVSSNLTVSAKDSLKVLSFKEFSLFLLNLLRDSSIVYLSLDSV